MFFDYADLATERERQSTTGKRVERTELDFQSPIYRFTIGQASCKPETAVNLKKPGTASQNIIIKKNITLCYDQLKFVVLFGLVVFCS